MRVKAGLLVILVVFPIHALAQPPCGVTRAFIPFKEQDKWGYASEKGVVISPRFDVAGLFNSESAIACIGGQCGFIDKSGTFIAPTWERGSRPIPFGMYSEGLASAENDGLWGYIDRRRRIVIPFQFKYAADFENGMARV